MTKPKTKAEPKPKASQLVNLRMDVQTLEAFQIIADKTGRSRSNLMKFALSEYLAANK